MIAVTQTTSLGKAATGGAILAPADQPTAIGDGDFWQALLAGEDAIPALAEDRLNALSDVIIEAPAPDGTPNAAFDAAVGDATTLTPAEQAFVFAALPAAMPAPDLIESAISSPGDLPQVQPPSAARPVKIAVAGAFSEETASPNPIIDQSLALGRSAASGRAQAELAAGMAQNSHIAAPSLPSATVPAPQDNASPAKLPLAATQPDANGPPKQKASALPPDAANPPALPEVADMTTSDNEPDEGQLKPSPVSVTRDTSGNTVDQPVKPTPPSDPQLSVAENTWRHRFDDVDPATRAMPLPASASAAAILHAATLPPTAQPNTPGNPAHGKPGGEDAAVKDKTAVSAAPQAEVRATHPGRPSKPAAQAESTAAPLDAIRSGGALAEPDMVRAAAQIAAPLPLAAASASLAPTVPPIIASTIAPTIVEMTKSGSDGPIELALAPEELGRLTISIRQEGDFVRVALAAERPETLDLLRRHAGDLLADLRQSGFSGASFSFGQSGQDHLPRPATAASDPKDAPHAQPTGPEPNPSVPNRAHRAGLDLRF